MAHGHGNGPRVARRAGKPHANATLPLYRRDDSNWIAVLFQYRPLLDMDLDVAQQCFVWPPRALRQAVGITTKGADRRREWNPVVILACQPCRIKDADGDAASEV